MNIKKIVLLVCGFLALLIGAIGILLPVLPTTPFVLVAAACFGGSSPMLYNKLRSNKYFGEYIENYRNNTGITKVAKIKSLVFLWVMLGISAVIIMEKVIILILLIVGIAVTTHILSIKSR